MTGTEIIAAIRRIPIDMTGYEDISPIYVKERTEVRTGPQLKALTRKWQALWEIPFCEGFVQNRLERQIISGRYNPKKVLRCLDINTSDDASDNRICKHVPKGDGCISAYILAPSLLMRLNQLSHHFGCPESVALVQLQRFLHEDLRDVDPDLFWETACCPNHH